MITLIPNYTNPNFLFNFPSSNPKINIKPTFNLHKKCQIYPHNTINGFIPSCTANSGDFYNGWDELRNWVDSDELGKSNYVKKLLIYLGIDDRKYVFTCLLGFVIGLVISRVRVSSIVVIPVTVVVFGIGFSFGFFNGGRIHDGLGFSWGKKGGNDEILGFYVKKLKNLGEIFDGFDLKIDELKCVVKKCIDDESVELSELESCVNVLESIGGLVLDARNVVEDCSCELNEVEKKSYRKNSQNKKEIGSNGFDLLGFLGSFLRDYGTDSKTSKRNVLKRESIGKDVDNRGQRVEQALDSVSTVIGGTPRVTSSNGGKTNKLGERDREMERMSHSGKMSEVEDHINSRNFLDDDNGGLNYQSRRFVDNRSFSFNMSSQREIRRWSVDDSMSSYTDCDLTEEHRENESSWSSHQYFGSSVGMNNVELGHHNDSFDSERMSVEDELHTRKYQSQTAKHSDPLSPSTVSDDLFNKYLTKASDLLKQAKECLKVGNDEIFAEEMLYESAKLLSEAVAMKPMSLLAIGQLGNTYLLHGELKLRSSRELRNCLLRSGDFSLGRRSDLPFLVGEALPNKDKVVTLLGKTCEECETLLVQAGRKYRTALSIDGSDLRALYNWGLALSFRAQLIADIGPEAALDADKLFLAAIDKFDAMMSRSNVYAPEALFRWGMALQQRSRLRPSSSRDKVKLLQQAKRLYKDALDMGSDNLQVRKALSSCMSELNFNDI